MDSVLGVVFHPLAVESEGIYDEHNRTLGQLVKNIVHHSEGFLADVCVYLVNSVFVDFGFKNLRVIAFAAAFEKVFLYVQRWGIVKPYRIDKHSLALIL